MLDTIFPRAEGYIYWRSVGVNPYNDDALAEVLLVKTPRSGTFFAVVGGPEPAEARAALTRFYLLQHHLRAGLGDIDRKGIVVANGQCRFYVVGHNAPEPRHLVTDNTVLHDPVNERWPPHAYDIMQESIRIGHILWEWKQQCFAQQFWSWPPGASVQE
ncbi:hypothetical protein BP00DRAFT_272226 [Aspergillus indologenus CBS 114.80]|uniref:Uncharacterized protein n=1 Tax=Aspergillus indologenus CBS 114.80 TaxID=1450541 RepID=A0A2V5I2J0_9EURO|nr:hypothetical protein BP00DRAFT_272226 [Aspergillus indologenus CBS 114.80]